LHIYSENCYFQNLIDFAENTYEKYLHHILFEMSFRKFPNFFWYIYLGSFTSYFNFFFSLPPSRSSDGSVPGWDRQTVHLLGSRELEAACEAGHHASGCPPWLQASYYGVGSLISPSAMDQLFWRVTLKLSRLLVS